jgi:hypothetical protein
VAIDYSVFAGLECALPKGQVRAIVKQAKAAKVATTDKKENAKAKARAKGQCEVRTKHPDSPDPNTVYVSVRCSKKDAHTHHLISGNGRRNKGKSILAAHKLRVCESCHRDIHAKILRPTSDTDEAAKIRYFRSR